MARTRTDLQIAADNHAVGLRRSLAAKLRELRRDAGLTQRAVAAAAGVTPSVLCRLESGSTEPALETYARVAAVLGADLTARVYPNTGPAIHDRHSVPMGGLLLAALHQRWRPAPEVRTRDPASGWVDLGLHDPGARLVVATELESLLRRIEQLLRWNAEKAASLPSSDEWPLWAAGGRPEISRLLVIRWTRANREAAASARRVLTAAYPSDPRDALASLVGTAGWPGPSILWARIDGERPTLLEARV